MPLCIEVISQPAKTSIVTSEPKQPKQPTRPTPSFRRLSAIPPTRTISTAAMIPFF